MKPKKPLRRMSPKKKDWKAKYTDLKSEYGAVQYCAKCNLPSHKDNMDPHHPFGQCNERIMAFLWLCKGCHQGIHNHGDEATAVGWLQPEFRSMPEPALEGRRIPWKITHETRWPKNLQFLIQKNNGITASA